jgi:hypothetical protein
MVVSLCVIQARTAGKPGVSLPRSGTPATIDAVEIIEYADYL